ncbi:hypothetical protein JCM16814_21660 [Desulfobaculum senezii]
MANGAWAQGPKRHMLRAAGGSAKGLSMTQEERSLRLAVECRMLASVQSGACASFEGAARLSDGLWMGPEKGGL